MTGSPISVRPGLAEVVPYLSPQRPARYRMNTNESPYPPPPGLVADVTEAIQRIAFNRYPDRDATKLYEALAEHVGWPADGIWIANGSNEVFLHLFLAFGGAGRSSMTFEPTYSLHTLIPKIAGTETMQVARVEDFEVDIDAAVERIHKDKPTIVLVCSPNNPTGALEPLNTVRVLLEETSCLVVVDEAYGEFADPEDSVRRLLDDYENLVVTKTFSKAWRLAGVRIGYMLGAPSLIGELRRVRLPYHLSAVTQVIGEAAIKHSKESLALTRAIAEERDRIVVELQAMGIKTYPSQANFVLFEVDDPDRTWKLLLEREVLVRNYARERHLENCLRVTAGMTEETDAFLAAMREVLDE